MDERYKSDAYLELSVSDAREHFSDAINRVVYGEQRVLLLRHGRPIAAIISFDELEVLEELEDAMDRLLAERVSADPEEEFVPWQAFEAELEARRAKDQAAAG